MFHGSLLQRPQVDTLCAHRVAGEGPGTVADSSVSRVGFRLTSAPHISVPIPSLTQNVLTAHVIGAYLSSVSPREQWLHLISEKYDVDYTGAYVELCDVAQILWVRHSFNFLFHVANERVVIRLMAPCREGYNKVNKVLSVLWAFCSHLH